MTYRYSWQSALGPMVAECNENSLITLMPTQGLDFVHRVPSHPMLQQVEEEIAEYFTGQRFNFTIPLAPAGTEFQRNVWQILCRIPYGDTRSYQEIATEADSPQASRAAGAACKKNPIILMVPCHRVISKNGSLTGYSAGGIAIKKRLIEMEQRFSSLQNT